jgi:hypothetical protein
MRKQQPTPHLLLGKKWFEHWNPSLRKSGALIQRYASIFQQQSQHSSNLFFFLLSPCKFTSQRASDTLPKKSGKSALNLLDGADDYGKFVKEELLRQKEAVHFAISTRDNERPTVNSSFLLFPPLLLFLLTLSIYIYSLLTRFGNQ